MANLGYQVEIDTSTPADWSEALQLFEDGNIYQTWSYGAVHWGEANLSHFLVRCNGGVVGMAQLRIIRPPFLKCGIAYLRWGPMCHVRGIQLNSEGLRVIAAALRAEYVEKRGLFLCILPNAFGGTERAAVFESAFSGFSVNSNPSRTDRTFVLDLSPPLDELRKNLDQKWRNQLNRAEKNGLSIIEGNGPAEYQTFTNIYRQMWARKRFDTTVDVKQFGQICDDLPPSLKPKVMICLQQGMPVAGIVCSTIGATGIYLLGATSDHGLQAKGAYLLQWAMIRRLKESGLRFYDLGGIDPKRNPGVYHFKSGLSGVDLTRMTPLKSCKNVLSSLCMRVAELLCDGSLRSLVRR